MQKIGKGLVVSALFGLICALQMPWFADWSARAITSVQAKAEMLGAPECTSTADEAYARSVELLSDGKQSEAEEIITSALNRYRDDKRIAFAKAVLTRSYWDKGEAAVWFRSCSGDTDYLETGAKLALALDRHENVAENMSALIQLSDKHPDDIYLLWLSAIQCREHEMGALGKARYELLLKKFRTGPVMAHHTYANILTEDLHDYETAMKHRTIVLSMTSRDWALQGMANTLTDSGDNLEALPVWRQLVELVPDDDQYWHRYGSVLERLERFSEAVPAFRKTVELDPSDDYAWMHLGLCLSMLGRHAEAFHCYQRAMKLEDAGNPFMMANHLLRNGNGKNSYQVIAARQAVVECYLLGRGVDKNAELARQHCGDSFESIEQYVAGVLQMAESLAQTDSRSHGAGVVKFADGTQLMTSCNALDVMVSVCEAAGRIDLAVATQQRLVTRCQSISTDQGVLDIQRERLARLERLPEEPAKNM